MFLQYDAADYGFEYSDEEIEEEDVDIENQYYNSKGRVTYKNSGKIVSSMQVLQPNKACRSTGEQRPDRSSARLPGSGQNGARQG